MVALRGWLCQETRFRRKQSPCFIMPTTLSILGYHVDATLGDYIKRGFLLTLGDNHFAFGRTPSTRWR